MKYTIVKVPSLYEYLDLIKFQDNLMGYANNAKFYYDYDTSRGYYLIKDQQQIQQINYFKTKYPELFI